MEGKPIAGIKWGLDTWERGANHINQDRRWPLGGYMDTTHYVYNAHILIHV